MYLSKKLSVIRTFSSVVGLAIIVGCASSSGSLQLSDEALSGNPDAMWADGQKAVKQGESLVARGQERMEDGRKLVREGESQIHEGNIDVLDSRRAYQAAVAGTGGSSSPDDVINESDRLKDIGNRWEDAIDDIRDGNAQVTKGNKVIDRAQTEIRDGRVLMESGSTLMRNAERIRRGEELLSPAAAGDDIATE